MNEQQRKEVGQRIWELRENSPETNRSIAEAVGVGERTVAAWVGGEQGISYDHAKAVAKLFEVDIDWLWRGREQGPTPDPLGEPDWVKRLEEKLDELAAALERNNPGDPEALTDAVDAAEKLADDEPDRKRRPRESGSA